MPTADRQDHGDALDQLSYDQLSELQDSLWEAGDFDGAIAAGRRQNALREEGRMQAQRAIISAMVSR